MKARALTISLIVVMLLSTVLIVVNQRSASGPGHVYPADPGRWHNKHPSGR